MSRRGRRSRGERRGVAEAGAFELPAGFRERMAGLLGPETEVFLEALSAPPSGLRVNTLKVPPERLRAMAPFELVPLEYPPEGFLVAEGERPGSHPYHAAGLYYLQDPGAMVVGAVPDLPEGARVLDLAAAPGGKSTHLAARLAGRGVLVANDVVPARARELAGNLERCGVRNAVVTAERPERLRERWGGWFDVVLVDAPCSGESMFHKSAAARMEWSPEAVLGCARRQQELLRDAVELVRPGGVLVYSTCTFAPEENEGVLAALLERHPELEPIDPPAIPGAEPARPDWVTPPAPPSVMRAIRLWPHRVPGAGHFVAILRRSDGPLADDAGQGHDAASPAAHAAPPAARPTSATLKAMANFFEEVLPGLDHSRLDVAQIGDQLQALPPVCPALARLRVLRTGWWLGTVRNGRFEPAHSLAMAIDPALAAQRIDLASDDPVGEVERYLRGETLRSAGEDGWVLVSVDGFSLGWGKRTGGVVKNHYPKRLRRR